MDLEKYGNSKKKTSNGHPNIKLSTFEFLYINQISNVTIDTQQQLGEFNLIFYVLQTKGC